MLTYGIPPEFRGAVHLFISNRHTLIATIFLHLHVKPSLQALDAFAEAFFLHSIEGHHRFKNSSDELVTWRDLGGKIFRSMFADNVSDASVNSY